jgi:hypothetical protein
MRWLVALVAACAGPPHVADTVAPVDPLPPAPPAVEDASSSPLEDETALEAEPAEVQPVVDLPDTWQRGSTHVHARPSGDSSTPITDVIAWYERHGYDFIVLTDHNQVSEIAKGNDTHGKPYVSAPDHGLIVLAGSELTNNPGTCIPVGDRGKCRIHVNVLGATERPTGKIDWAERKSDQRLDKYQAALVETGKLGGMAQINHPQWLWGMNKDLLVELANRGVKLFEVANAQFRRWDAGDSKHPSTEQLWDDALSAGVTLWGVASDDAHDYGEKRGKYPAGGAWIAVRARRDPQAILDAIAAGQFYASTGVVLDHAEASQGDLVVSVAPNETGDYTIAFVEMGKVVDTIHARSARRAVPATGYLRAVVTRDDGKKAWVQPARK